MPAVNHELLRSKRDELDLSNGDLAAKAEVSPNYLVNIVSGVNNPSMRIVHRLSRALGLAVEDIVMAKPTGDPSDPPTQPAGGPKAPPTRKDTEKRTAPKRNEAPDRLQAAS
ncbi:helix-turn-helix transcriptional regulator [Amycolatopsis sp. NPDC051128]|uniref:helix-turn-helix transcriptional regulator n=1 Tax=Amycolatopsis sp. NPDC051128 TaxID=3155412 RepID=UPI0034390481